MVENQTNQDKHFPLFVHYNPIRRLFFSKPNKYCSYLAPGEVVADLGCGPGSSPSSWQRQSVPREPCTRLTQMKKRCVLWNEGRRKKGSITSRHTSPQPPTSASFQTTQLTSSSQTACYAPWHHTTTSRRRKKYFASSSPAGWRT
jgi:hypothetical protein